MPNYIYRKKEKDLRIPKYPSLIKCSNLRKKKKHKILQLLFSPSLDPLSPITPVLLGPLTPLFN